MGEGVGAGLAHAYKHRGACLMALDIDAGIASAVVPALVNHHKLRADLALDLLRELRPPQPPKISEARVDEVLDQLDPDDLPNFYAHFDDFEDEITDRACASCVRRWGDAAERVDGLSRSEGVKIARLVTGDLSSIGRRKADDAA